MITISGVVLGVAVISAIVAITTLRPNADNTTVLALLPAFAAVTLTSIFTALKAEEAVKKTDLNRTEIQKLQISVDGRLSELMEKTAEAARLSGHVEGRMAAKEEIIPLIKDEVIPTVIVDVLNSRGSKP